MKSKLKNIKIAPTAVYQGIVSFFHQIEFMKLQKNIPSVLEDLSFRYPGLTLLQLSEFGTLYRNFEDGNISYKELMERVKALDIDLIDSVIFKEFCFKEDYEKEAFRQRKANENYLPIDIFGFHYRIPGTEESHLIFGNDNLITELLTESEGKKAKSKSIGNIL